MNTILTQIAQLQIIPVVVIDVEEHAMPLADALVDGGLPIAEITFRTDAAESAIRAMAVRGDLLVGAGTVLTIEQADRAIDAGAAFIVAPGTNRHVVEHCLKRDVPVTPGVATPTDIELALSLGLETLKFFPAAALGGVPMLKAISAPYRQVRFVPTGGISLENVLDYLALPQVLACGGSWLVSRDKLANRQFDAIRDTVATAVGRLGATDK
jgi:2-dehydro-3-deoxyphosphogluconate aldolase/(4S)-4-hydroxy-2-oxoglutarate aldolase